MPHLRTREERKLKAEIYTLANPQNHLDKVYYKKAITYGKYVDIIEYNELQYSIRYQRYDYSKRSKGEKRDDNLKRARENIYRLVAANIRAHGRYKPIFITLTSKERITELDTFHKHFKQFIRRGNDYLGYSQKYVCVPEIQTKRERRTGDSVWHYHCVFFNTPFIPYKIWNSWWPLGNLDGGLIRNIRDVSAYLAKYLTKQSIDSRLFGRKTYMASRGLLRPTESYQQDEIDSLLSSGKLQLVTSYEGFKATHSKYKICKTNTFS